MKAIIAHIVGGKSLSLLIAAFAALATSSAWAGMVWIGDGADEYIDTTGNRTDGTAYRGNYFVDAITNSNSGVVSYASKTTVRFNSYKDFGNADIRFGRASLTDPDKIWTVIADNDECGFKNNYNLEVGSNGYDCLGDAYLRILYGKYSTANVYIGPNANNPATRSVLSIGSDGHASIFTATDATGIEIRNGALITTNTAVTCGNLTAANKNNSTVTIDKTGGDWCVGNLAMNTADGTTATFYNRGGNLVVTNDLTVQNRGSGEFYMEGGHVIVSNIVRFGEWAVPANGIANLYLNGGVFEANKFRFHNSSGPYGYVVFNGGTYKAMADGSVAATDGRLGAVARLYFKVGERGGTIDTAGHDVVFPLQLLQDGSSTGGICVKGGGSLTLENDNVTYTGKTCIEAGTTLVVSNSTVKSNILSQGIELVGAPSVGTEYTVFRCNDALDEGTDLANVTCPVAESFTTGIGADGKSIVVTATALKSGYWTGAKDNNLSDTANWSDGNVPTGNANIYCPVATTLTVGGTFAPSTITIPDDSAVVTIGAGALHVNTLTNVSKLAIGAGASLEVDGDIVAKPSTSGGEAHFLYSNEGSVIVHGNAVGIATGTASVYEYTVGNANTKPMQVGGIRYEAGGNVLYFHINSAGTYYNQDPGSWVVGGNGIGFVSGRENVVTHYYTQYGGSVMLHSSADWTLANSMKNNTSQGEIMMSGNGAITFDTSDYNDQTVPRTITLQGRLYAASVGMTHSAFIIDGCGTVIVDTADMSSVTGIADPLKHTCITNSILQVKSGATLQVNAGKKITGANGRIALDAGATLTLVSGGTDDFVTRIEPAVTLPTDGVATIRIDGARLAFGDHVLLAGVAADALDHVTVNVAAEVIDGRKWSLKVEDGNLVLNIIASPGLMFIVK